MKRALLIVCASIGFYFSKAQVGISPTNTPPHSSAMLDVASTQRGMLMPRMTTTQRRAIASPATGLMVFDLTTKSSWFFNGTMWKEFAAITNSDSSFIFMKTTAPSYDMSQGLAVADSSAFIYDSGGPDGGYGNNEDITMSVSFPAGSQMCRVQIISLTTEANLDSLRIFTNDKNHTYSGNISNQSIFFNFSYEPINIRFVSNASSTRNGFQIRVDHYFVNSTITSDLSSTKTGFHYIPEKVAVAGGSQTNNNWHKDSVGSNSIAFGYGTKAKGNYSFATGVNTSATGEGASASGGESLAGGSFSSASGIGSIAPGYASTVVGSFNDPVIATNETSASPSTPLFVIGNGNNNTSRSNAMLVRKDGTVGIGTSSPASNAIVDISSDNKGVLLPRMTMSLRDAMTTVPAGLIIYQTDNTPGYYFHDGTKWVGFHDNLGNHILSQRLQTNNNFISKDAGTNIGLQMLVGGGMRVVTTDECNGCDITHEKFKVDRNGGLVLKTRLGVGVIPVSGPGERVMWHPYYSAFRAGGVETNEWDDANIGFYSAAFGYTAIAAGNYSFSSGYFSASRGQYSVAMGYRNSANGIGSLALGYGSTAANNYSVALGFRANSKTFTGTMVMSDASSTSSSDSTFASANNQFTARYAGGYRLYSNSSKTIGVMLNANGNSWMSISDSTKKENFVPASTESFLEKLSKLRLGSWNYKGQNPASLRHYGPMAQEIFAAFGKDKYGTIGNDTTLATADMDGIMMIMLKGLEQRTEKIKGLEAKMEILQKENAEMKKDIEELKKVLLK